MGGWRSLVQELRCILAVYLGTVIGGYSMGLSAVVIPDIVREQQLELKGNSSTFLPVIQATSEQLSWFASSVNLGQVVGGLLGGYCGGRFGPRRTIMAFCLPAILAWLLIGLAPNLEVLTVGRVLAGVSSSVNSANCSMLVAQYASTPRRGAFLSLFALMVGLGVLLVYTLGSLLPWRPTVLLLPALLLLLLVALLPNPESPIWLLSHRGHQQAAEALRWLRASQDVDAELEELNLTRERQAHGLTMSQALVNLRHPHVHRPFLLVTANFMFVMFSGPFAMIFYGVQIFQETGVDANLAAILVAAIRVLGGLLAIGLISRLPRRGLAMATMTLMGGSMAVLGGVLYLQERGADSPVLRVLPVLCVLVFMFGFGAGAGPLQWVFLGELLPPEYKVLSGIMTSLATLAIFLVTKVFPTILASPLGAPGAYWMFSSVALLSNLFYLTCMPESRGKTMLEVRAIFDKEQ